MSDDLMARLEKTAGIGGLFKGIGNYAKNVTGAGVRKAQSQVDNISTLPTQANKAQMDLAQKNLHNAKVDRNIARAGTAGAGITAGAGLGGYTAYQKSKEPVVTDTMEQNQITQYQPKVASEDLMDRLEKTASVHEQPKVDLMESLEKTANEAYGNNPDYENHMKDQQITKMIVDLYDKDPSYLEHSLQSAGLMDRAIENGVFRDLTPGEGLGYGAGAGGFMGGLTGLAQGAIMGASEGKPLKGAGLGGLAGGLIGAGVGGAIGGVEGLYRKNHPSELHLKYYGGQGAQQPAEGGAPNQSAQPTAPDVASTEAATGVEEQDNPRQGAGSVSHAPAGADKTASELMERLEKTAEEQHPQRQDRSFATESFIGAGPLGYYAKENNTLGVNPEDSHAKANAKLFALQGGGLGALSGALTGGLAGHMNGGNVAAGAGIGALAGGAYGAATGALGGAINGRLHDRWDKKHPVQEKEASTEELMASLEKTAASIPGVAGIAGKAKNFVGNVTGKNAKNAKDTFNTWNTPEALKANAPQMGVAKFRQHLEGLEGAAAKAQADTKKARIGAGVAGAGAGVAGVGAAAAGGDKEEKVASTEDDVLTGLFKEAAAAIIDEKLPEVKQHVDPMSRIKF